MNKSSGLNSLAKEIHQNAVAHGWWEQERSLAEILMLCVSELSEALEEDRNNAPSFYCKNYDEKYCGDCLSKRNLCGNSAAKPEGVAVELADCIIRILDYCGHAGINIEETIQIKHEYNKGRPYRHGGKKC